MKVWHELTVWTSNEAVEMVANFFHDIGAGGVVIEDSGSAAGGRDMSLGQWYDLPPSPVPEGQAIVQAYFPGEEEVRAAERGVRELLGQLAGYPIDTGPGTTEIRQVKEEDWENAWKQHFKPVRISDRLVVKPTWEPYEPRPGDIVLELDPGMAFGTGTHPSTSLCLKALEKRILPGMAVIDVGTGSGILAIAAVRLGARRVLALDLDPVAVRSASDNAAQSGLSDRIRVMESDLLQAALENPDPAFVPADLVVANLLAEIVVRAIPDVHRALKPGGLFISSGIISAKAAAVRRALEEAGFGIEAVDEEDGWAAVTAVKRG